MRMRSGRRHALPSAVLIAGCCVTLLLACAPTGSVVTPPTATVVPGTSPCAFSVANAPATDIPAANSASVATVDPTYIYDQLDYMANHFPHREAGYDTQLPPTQNGHDEFAAYWAQQALHDLAGFGPTLRCDPFPVQGWSGRPAAVPAFNVEVTVPGIVHPEQVVVIGCHYDGEAVSTQSANDDASGCAIELGVARAMGQFWRGQHVYPARTLRFVLFDAEEQGLFGSFHYLNRTINGEGSHIVAMFNEEQSGIAYPLRYLGKLANPLLPFYLDMTPLHASQLYPNLDQITPAQRDAITGFRGLMQQAVPAVFQQFQALGYTALNYAGAQGQPVSQPIFTPDQTSNILAEDDALGSSDQVPFSLAGLPCATFAGNFSYYDQNPPPWSYPFDQAADTIQLMNIFASGSDKRAPALVLALGLPGMLTTWMLSQPAILGQAPADGKPIAAIGDIGPTVVGQRSALDANAAFDPGNAGALTYTWNFGDGAAASGVAVNHIYTSSGTYTIKLTVRA
ncbi:MAG TPA: M28 family peptidase, partial [Ktedonobacterales bacterium]|nr:M28 family peptidase [Ktedonobacterales bacterium]